nr:S-adenosylmethionine decarboxylase [Leptolyngbya sp. FACHB-36]
MPATETIVTLLPAALLDLMRDAVQEAGLTAVGEVAVTFAPQGLSAVLVLEESHVALHLWTEYAKVSVDIHVCDYSQDNRSKAEVLADVLSLKISGQVDRAQWHSITATG